MITREDVKTGLQALLDFVIVAGSTLGGAMLQAGTPITIPGPPVQLLAVIMGTTVAARRIQTMLEGSPRETLEQTVRMLVAQMRGVQVTQAVVTDAVKYGDESVSANILKSTPPAPAPARTLAEVQAKAHAQAAKDAAVAPSPFATP